jgi:hypothetical protein
MPAYHSAFDHGDAVVPLSKDELVKFQKEWKFHHPIKNEQIKLAGTKLYVEQVSYYHGGDPLYSLFDWNGDGTKILLPDLWHEMLLLENKPSWARVQASTVLEAVADTYEGHPVVIIRNKATGVIYSMTRHLSNELVAKDYNEVFALRDVHMAARKYNFELDFKPETKHVL